MPSRARGGLPGSTVETGGIAQVTGALEYDIMSPSFIAGGDN